MPMLYAAGPDRGADRPAHVRAASGLAWIGERLAVVQDDANFVALVDVATGAAEAVALPRGAGGLRLFDRTRGNKAQKLDLEALVRVPGPAGARLLALGSGSTANRHWIALISGLESPNGAPVAVAMHQAEAFYARLIDATAFAGSELNIEGATFLGDRLRLFGRGNGAVRGEVLPVNATCNVDWSRLEAHLASPESVPAPAPSEITQYELGTLDGIRLGFTDAALQSTDRNDGTASTLYSAAAEASPDATRDGTVAGSAIGIIVDAPGTAAARWIELMAEDGRPFRGKVEGIAVDPRSPGCVYVAVDRDDHEQPSVLCEVVLSGPWAPAYPTS